MGAEWVGGGAQSPSLQTHAEEELSSPAPQQLILECSLGLDRRVPKKTSYVGKDGAAVPAGSVA